MVFQFNSEKGASLPEYVLLIALFGVGLTTAIEPMTMGMGDTIDLASQHMANPGLARLPIRFLPIEGGGTSSDIQWNPLEEYLTEEDPPAPSPPPDALETGDDHSDREG